MASLIGRKVIRHIFPAGSTTKHPKDAFKDLSISMPRTTALWILAGSGVIFESISPFSSVIPMLVLRMSDHGFEVMRPLLNDWGRQFRSPMIAIPVCPSLRVVAIGSVK